MTEQTLNDEALKAFFDSLTDDQKFFTVKTVLSDLRKARPFARSLGHISELHSIQMKIEKIVVEFEEEAEREAATKAAQKAILNDMINSAAQVYINAQHALGNKVSEKDAIEIAKQMIGAQAIASGTETNPATKEKKAPKESVKFTLSFGGKLFEDIALNVRGRNNADLKAAFDAASVPMADKYKYVVVSDRSKVIEAVAQNKISDFPLTVEQLKEFYAQDDATDDNGKVILTLMLDTATAKEKFNVDITEDFVFEGTEEDLINQHEKLLIAVSDDDTVEGGVSALEAL